MRFLIDECLHESLVEKTAQYFPDPLNRGWTFETGKGIGRAIILALFLAGNTILKPLDVPLF